ncbi:CRISPR-associated protein Cas5h [Algoriphagus ornithinivorans]|uniref:CRISPR-associated protein Cas5h n=1 Tax=Algoriphagus ornithinivorans TaxID=226506 RepID=A0A1I5E4P8_9BACT|nr:CRISPR-associated protein Cas5 [Algoriphagus ornithinivorans]SFO06432.1 CRISPR-associated protein Cas5h [Algoriphagus ornithinivorans]
MEKLISIDLKADFGFLRKPDTNDGISMTYNMLHKPGLLGIFGAILGLEGYQKRGVLPEYYQKLKDLKVGIEPLGHQNGNFPKTTIVYTNTVGYANKDGNFMAYENTLIKPSYRVYLALTEVDPLLAYLKNSHAEYIPYLGKNEFPIWWENFMQYELKPFDFNQDFEVKTLFVKKEENNRARSKESGNKPRGFASLLSQFRDSFFYFERLPFGFREFKSEKRGIEYQYDLIPFVYSNARFDASFRIDNLYALRNSEVVQLN